MNRTGVTFTQPSATLRYDLEPVAGWFITAQGDTSRKVYLTVNLQLYTSLYVCMHSLQITEKDIDYQQQISRLQSESALTGDALSKLKILQELENFKQYPPRLSLEIFRSQHAQEHLRTDVTITGVEPQFIFGLFTLCPG